MNFFTFNQKILYIIQKEFAAISFILPKTIL